MTYVQKRTRAQSFLVLTFSFLAMAIDANAFSPTTRAQSQVLQTSIQIRQLARTLENVGANHHFPDEESRDFVLYTLRQFKSNASKFNFEASKVRQSQSRIKYYFRSLYNKNMELAYIKAYLPMGRRMTQLFRSINQKVVALVPFYGKNRKVWSREVAIESIHQTEDILEHLHQHLEDELGTDNELAIEWLHKLVDSFEDFHIAVEVRKFSPSYSKSLLKDIKRTMETTQNIFFGMHLSVALENDFFQLETELEYLEKVVRY